MHASQAQAPSPWKWLGAGCAFVVSLCLAHSACAQASPSTAWGPAWDCSSCATTAPGYSGAINTPTADVLTLGTWGSSWNNSNPEIARRYPNGTFGSINFNFGVLPGLEGGLRLTYDGDIFCNTYDSGCQSGTRDLSFNGKYQLPLKNWLPLNGRVAIGVSDFGGAATLYRQSYAVGTISLGPVDVSAGNSVRGGSTNGLMNGVFGNAVWHVTDRLRLMAENDTQENRLGASYFRPLGPEWSWGVGWSQKLSHNTAQQISQASVTLAWAMDGKAAQGGPSSVQTQRTAQAQPLPHLNDADKRLWPATAPLLPTAPLTSPARSSDEHTHTSGNMATTETLHSSQPPAPSADPQTIGALAVASLQRHGFSDISVGQYDNAWVVKAEPRLWRKNRMDGMAAAMAAWVRSTAAPAASLHVVLTSMGVPVMQATSSKACIESFYMGSEGCSTDTPMVFEDRADRMRALLRATSWVQQREASGFGRPQLEISPSASYTLGTEFGLFDYSLGASLGWEVPLMEGWFWHGYVAQRYEDSKNFDGPNSVFRGRYGLGENTGQMANNLTYIRPLVDRLVGEVVVGQLSPTMPGHSVGLTWADPTGRVRFNALSGRYTKTTTTTVQLPSGFYNTSLLADWSTINNLTVTTTDVYAPSLFTTRVNLIPGKWSASLVNGQFLNNDPGYLFISQHSFGDNAVRFYYRQTGPGNDTTPKRVSFAGISVNFPLGPSESKVLGPVSVRARDRWALGVETKVNEADNYFEIGYGLFPTSRHGLTSDFLDYDRADLGTVAANLYRFKATLKERIAEQR